MKTKEKKVLCILILLTFITISIPLPFSYYKHIKFEKSISQWKVISSSPVVSSKDFVAMYINNNIEYIAYYAEQIESSVNLEQVKSLVSGIFTDSILKQINDMINLPIIYQENKSFILLINQQPVAFNLVLVSFSTNDGQILEIVYEQRTSTLLQLTIQTNNISSQGFEIIANSLSRYYENYLGLSSNHYEISLLHTNDEYNTFSSYIIHDISEKEDIEDTN